MQTYITNVAPFYPGTMTAAINAWLDAARYAGYRPIVKWREDGNGSQGLAVADLQDGYGDWVRVFTRTHPRYTTTISRKSGVAKVNETRPSDGSCRWRYFPVWEGPVSELPAEYKGEGRPYLITADLIEDDYELYLLTTPDGSRRAGVTSGMPSDYAAWMLGALQAADNYQLDRYDLHGDLSRPDGPPETAANLAEGVAYWEKEDRAWRARWSELFTE